MMGYRLRNAGYELQVAGQGQGSAAVLLYCGAAVQKHKGKKSTEKSCGLTPYDLPAYRR